ncbi:hypothetical protein Trydic_g11784 [Trypoxylus dichotomus]
MYSFGSPFLDPIAILVPTDLISISALSCEKSIAITHFLKATTDFFSCLAFSCRILQGQLSNRELNLLDRVRVISHYYPRPTSLSHDHVEDLFHLASARRTLWDVSCDAGGFSAKNIEYVLLSASITPAAGENLGQVL